MRQRWRESDPILAYDDADIRVVFQPGGSDVLLVTFGDALALVDGLRFAADALVRKHGLACLGFMAHQANWFPADAIARAVPHIAYTLRSFPRVLAYGSSMGGYAAIKHAAALGATNILALGPQWSIDPAECAWDCGYHDFYRSRMAGMGIRAADLAGRIAVFYDPGHALDRRHADAIAALGPSVTRFHVPNADHHLAPMLAGSDAMFDLMQAWLRNDTGAVHRLLALGRRPSPIRIRILLAKAVVRHPAFALAAMEHLGRTGRIGLVEPQCHLIPLLRTLLAQGRVGLAAHALSLAGSALPPVQLGILRRDLTGPHAGMTMHDGAIRTVHGTILVYDSLSNGFRHVAVPIPDEQARGLHPAGLEHGRSGRLLVWTGGAPMACVLGEGGRLELTGDAGADKLYVQAVKLPPPAFALAVGGRYLCASPDGQIFHDRTEMNAWERFGLGSALQ